jgi:hypothetical protein
LANNYEKELNELKDKPIPGIVESKESYPLKSMDSHISNTQTAEALAVLSNYNI